MKTISTCAELLEAFSDDTETEFVLNADLDFADYGQIFASITKNTASNTVIDLNKHEITNIYPVFTDVLILSAGTVTVKNGKITNVLCADGHYISINSGISPNMYKYSEFFAISSTQFKIKFEKISFSILGCNYDFQKSKKNTGIVYANNDNSSYLHTTVVFDRCSFYIRSVNSIPLTNYAIFKNCSLYFDDCEYNSLDYEVNAYQSSGVVSHSIFFFCVIKGKIVKSDEFTRNGTYSRKTMGELINCYVDLKTDIDDIFINVSLNADPKNLTNFLKTLDESTLQPSYIGTDTVYNNAGWLGEEGKKLIVGGQSLTEEQLHDADYLMQCGFLAIDEAE